MLMTYSVNTNGKSGDISLAQRSISLFASLWSSFYETHNAMATLDASSLAERSFSLSALLYTSFAGPLPMDWPFWRRLAGTTELFFVDIVIHQHFQSQAAGPLYVHDNTTGSGDLRRATFQHAQFAVHLPSVHSCASSTIEGP